MMEDILYLEPDEEITSVIDKLKAVSGDSVALVLPKGAVLAKSVVNLRLLEREARELKKEIAIVTQDAISMKLAAHVGIPVYASATDAEPITPTVGPKPSIDDVIEIEEPQASEPASPPVVPVRRYDDTAITEAQAPAAPVVAATVPTATPSKNPKKLDRSGAMLARKRRFVTIGGLLAVALIAGLYWFFALYPQASVTLTLKSDPFEETIQARVDNAATTSDPETGTVPGQKIETEVVAKETFEATGEKEIGTKATGTVQLSNGLGEPVQIAAGAELSRAGNSFLTTEAVTVPAAKVSLDSGGNPVITPGKASVGVEAAQPGDQYNLGAGSFAIAGLSGAQTEKVTATNSEAFAGGQSQTVKVVTESDIDRAKNGLIDAQREILEQQLKDQAGAKTMMSGTTDIEVMSSTSSKQSGEEADSFELEATLRARTIAFSFSDLEAVVLAKVRSVLPENKELVLDEDQDTLETTVERLDFSEGVLVVNATLRTKVVATLDQDEIRQAIAGKTAAEAEALLAEREGVIEAAVQLRPTLRERIPTSDRQIVLELDRE